MKSHTLSKATARVSVSTDWKRNTATNESMRLAQEHSLQEHGPTGTSNPFFVTGLIEPLLSTLDLGKLDLELLTRTSVGGTTTIERQLHVERTND
jgi:hypothetical protein